jgi:ABC-type phosphate transport system auxiliary subunit
MTIRKPDCPVFGCSLYTILYTISLTILVCKRRKSKFIFSQLEIVNLNSTRQQLEHELGCARLDLDGSRQELRSERARHETEIDSLRGRLKRTEEQLVI